MIQSIKLVNFRNFGEKIIQGFEEKNFIIGENGAGKTNILEAISLLGNNSITNLQLDLLVKNGEDYFFIEIIDNNIGTLSLYYEKIGKKRKYSINQKKISKNKFIELSYSCVIFSPIIMNMLYLGPSLRRDFLDGTLKRSFGEFENIQKKYKKILKSRNSLLKAVHEQKATRQELSYWDTQFINIAIEFYSYRFRYVDFLQKKAETIQTFFSIFNKSKEEKHDMIEFIYITKINKENIEESIQEYLEKNRERDTILGKTHIGPHIDDFEIQIQDTNIISFGSRGEVKSAIIYLKLLEGVFLEKMNHKKPLLIIDDLLSELDSHHSELLLEKIGYYQSFISNIKEDPNTFFIKI